MEEKITKEEQPKLKLQLITSDELWNNVLRYKIQRRLKNNNQAVEELIRTALKPERNELIVTNENIPDDAISEIDNFRSVIPLVEDKNNAPLFISKDAKSDSFFTECHIKASDLVKFTDQDLSIDPELQEEYRANRELEPDNTYFLKMVEDANQGRAFSDIVIEFNTTYKEAKPLKILGGQHRDEAIKRALKEGVDVIHGIRVYFNLNKDQRAEIMRISNTNINVSPDLRDRIEEHRLEPSGMLRKFCYETGILNEKEDFDDKRRYEDFTPTVRMIRSFIVNFYRGKEYKGDIDKDAKIPYLCESGRDTDKEYLKIFNKFKKEQRFGDTDLIGAGKMFAKLHDAQFDKADKMKTPSKRAYKVKAYSLAIITSWSFAVGVLQSDEKRLKKLYDLPDLSGDNDPLNAVAMSKAKHKSDPEGYRGLGTRNDEKERGRLLHLFLGYSNAQKPKITDDMCQAAIDIFHSNDDTIRSEEKRKRAF